MKNKYFISMIFSTIIAFSVITGCGDKKGNTEPELFTTVDLA